MSFPEGFLWGAATAAHQVEGGNVNSDFWALEHQPGSMFAEPSGDACDHYRLFRQDIALLAELGLGAYRFSVEWARVETAPGRYSKSALAHYGEVLQTCHDHGITPMVTMHHFSSPRWLTELGGWEDADTPVRFAEYCATVLAELGPLIPYACTINEANIGPIIGRMITGPGEKRKLHREAMVGLAGDAGAMRAEATPAQTAADAGRRQLPRGVFLFTFSDKGLEIVCQAHRLAREAIKRVSPDTKVGITLALQDVQAQPGGEAEAGQMWARQFTEFLPVLDGDDFLGVQNYSRTIVGPEGIVPASAAGAEVTQLGYEIYPQALGNLLRRVAGQSDLPLFVTENGIATADDSRRSEFIRLALEGVERALDGGADVRGYFYWSALDNFEWMLGYRPTFGIIAVDRETQRRTVKDSARYLGGIAQRNALP
jgi:beta-glucosidase